MMLDPERSGAKEFLMVKKSARRTRRTHSAAFKARVALAAVRGDCQGHFNFPRGVKYYSGSDNRRCLRANYL